MQRDYAKRVVWLSVVSSAPGKQGFTTAEEADELTREKGAAPTAVIRDTAGTLGRLYGARNTPQYAIIDPQGVLRYAGAIDDRPSAKRQGHRDGDELRPRRARRRPRGERRSRSRRRSRTAAT